MSARKRRGPAITRAALPLAASQDIARSSPELPPANASEPSPPEIPEILPATLIRDFGLAAPQAGPAAASIPKSRISVAGAQAPLSLPIAAPEPTPAPQSLVPTSLPAVPLPAAPPSPGAPARSVYLVHGGGAGEAPPRLVALAAALSARGRSCRAIAVSELRGVRDAILVFAGDTRAGLLLRARLSGNLIVLDVRGAAAGPRIPGGARLVGGAIFRNRRQQRDLDRPRWTSRVIYDEPEPGLAPHGVPEGEFRAACFGARAAGEHFGRLRGVAFIDSHPLRHAGQFNCHVVLRVPGPAELYQPGAEVANAAACGAVLVTMRDAAALELLGEDYPFYCTGDRAVIESTVERVRRLCGSGEWRTALERLAAAGAQATLDRAVASHLEHFAAVERANLRVHGEAGKAPPAATGAAAG